MDYTLDSRQGPNGGWVGLVQKRNETGVYSVYTTEELFGSFPTNAMVIAEREYLEGLKFEEELREVDSVRKERY